MLIRLNSLIWAVGLFIRVENRRKLRRTSTVYGGCHMSEQYPFIKERPIDLIAMGRVSVDLYSEQFDGPLKNVQTFRKTIGGRAAKVALGISRLGLKSCLLSCVSDDAMGHYVQQVLEKEQVDLRLLTESKNHHTALCLLGANLSDPDAIVHYAENSADMQINQEQCNRDIFQQAKALLITGSLFSSTVTQYAVNLAKELKMAVIFDLSFCENAQPSVNSYQKLFAKCDLIVGTEHEICEVGNNQDILLALKAIRKLTTAAIIVKTVSRGCEIFVGDSGISLGFPGFAVEPSNKADVGDVFLSGFLSAWLRGEKWKICAQFANAASAISAIRLESIPAIPTHEELEYFIRHYRGNEQIMHDSYFSQLTIRSMHRQEPKKDLCILSFDHRWQFEQSCEEVGRDKTLISAFKTQVFSGFKMAASQFPEKQLGILIDPIYGKEVLREATEMNITVGVPIEAAGSFPLQWISEQPLYQQILRRPETWIVKVLWKYHPAMETGLKLRQLSQLELLSTVCRELGRLLMLEITIPSSFNSDGKEIAQAIEEVYQHRIYPSWWKISPVKSLSEWQAITDMCFYYDSNSRIIISCGLHSANQDWSKQFKQFKRSKIASGFAVGRLIYWDSWQQLISGDLSLQEVPVRVAEKFTSILKTWETLEKTPSPAKALG